MDVLLPSEIFTASDDLVCQIDSINSFEIPRWLSVSSTSSPEQAYEIVVYLRSSSSSVLVLSKVRLSPSNKTTIPSMELLAALITAQLLVFIQTELKLPDVKCFAWSIRLYKWSTSSLWWEGPVVENCVNPTEFGTDVRTATFLIRNALLYHRLQKKRWWCSRPLLLKLLICCVLTLLIFTASQISIV